MQLADELQAFKKQCSLGRKTGEKRCILLAASRKRQHRECMRPEDEGRTLRLCEPKFRSIAAQTSHLRLHF